MSLGGSLVGACTAHLARVSRTCSQNTPDWVATSSINQFLTSWMRFAVLAANASALPRLSDKFPMNGGVGFDSGEAARAASPFCQPCGGWCIRLILCRQSSVCPEWDRGS